MRAGALSMHAWAPFGWLPVDDTDPADSGHRLVFERQDPHVNVISHSRDEIRTRRGLLRCSEMYRHDTHTQALLVLNTHSVIAVAPRAAAFASRSDSGAIRAFRLKPGDAVVLNQGTWHWGPFPLGDEPVRLFNLQGRHYLDDNVRVDLEAVGAAVDVEAGSVP